MKKKEFYCCDRCDSTFDDKQECEKHEESCGKPIINKCDKCSQEEDIADDEYGWKSEGWYHIDLGRPGYGSGLDGCDVNFLLCDDCIREFIDTFSLEGQEKIHNSGSNQCLSSEDWIRVQKGEMPDEEMEEKAMYSPRQVKAYEDRFPTCDKVKIVEYENGGRGSNCFRHAFGDEHGNCGGNISDECFNCNSYKKREENQEIPVVYKKIIK